MNSLCNSIFRSNENKYLDHLARNASGQSPIGWSDKRLASSAQNHPIANTVKATLSGINNGTFFTGLGLIAYPLINETTRDNILGDSEVCTECTASFAKLLWQGASEVFKQSKTWGNGIENTWSFSKTMGELGIKAVSNCVDGITLPCRIANLASAVLDTIQEHSYLVAGCAVALTTIFILRKKFSLEHAEHTAHKNLVGRLISKYEKIADKLQERSNTADASQREEIRILSQKILANKTRTKNELRNLDILTDHEIEDITRPVFDVANKIV